MEAAFTTPQDIQRDVQRLVESVYVAVYLMRNYASLMVLSPVALVLVDTISPLYSKTTHEID